VSLKLTTRHFVHPHRVSIRKIQHDTVERQSNGKHNHRKSGTI